MRVIWSSRAPLEPAVAPGPMTLSPLSPPLWATAWDPLLSLGTFVGPRTLGGPGTPGAYKPLRAQESLGAKGCLVYQGLVGRREHKEH
jgi:hypothetical protein